MNEILKKIAKLIDLKSIVTLLLTVGFLYLAVTSAIKGETFTTVYTTVIAFYFGTQSLKSKGGE